MRSEHVNLISLQTVIGASRRLAVLIVFVASLCLAPSALAAGSEPVISNVSATAVTEYGATLEARINPEGSETSYEILLECQLASLSSPICEPVVGGAQARVGHIAVDAGEQTVSDGVSGLRAGYIYYYGVLATNSAGKAEVRGRSFETQAAGACGDGCPYETHVSKEAEELGQKFAEGAPAREAERQAKAAKEREEREAALAKDDQPIATPTSGPSTPAAGGVTLASTGIVVQKNGTVLVKLNCLGIESCRGKLTLTAKDAVKVQGAHARDAKGKKASAVSIGIVSYSVAGDETKTVDVKLDAAGRALLSADRGRLSASLAILELAPNPANTQTKAVRLVQRKSVKGRHP
jgi:hypothetical protein